MATKNNESEVKKCNCGSPWSHEAQVSKLRKMGKTNREIAFAIGHFNSLPSLDRMIITLEGRSVNTEDELERMVGIIKGGNLTSEWIAKLLLAIMDLAKKRGIGYGEGR